MGSEFGTSPLPSETPILNSITASYPHPEKLRIENPLLVEELLKKIAAKGASHLQVITDFDHTLTKFRTKDGLLCDSCHGIIDNSPLVPKDFREKALTLRGKYYPIEIDPKIDIDAKIPIMVEWYEKSHGLLAECKFTKSLLKEMAFGSRALLRDGATDVLQRLEELDVPVLIFSAGIGDLLEFVLEREKVDLSKVKVVSNYIEYDDKDCVKAFKGPLIHMYNKNETALEHSDYFDSLAERCNALVLGDSLGDVKMDEGMPGREQGASLKIAFLNDKIPERLDDFMKQFHIVLLDDQSFEFVRIVLNHIN